MNFFVLDNVKKTEKLKKNLISRKGQSNIEKQIVIIKDLVVEWTTFRSSLLKNCIT